MDRSAITKVDCSKHVTVREDRPRRGWWAGLIAHNPRLAARFSYFYARLRALKRSQRRLARRMAGTLAGAALLLALSGAPVHASTITVVNGEVAVQDNGLCSLVEAIANAEDTNDGQPYDDCAAGAPSGADTIVLPAGGLFSLTANDNILYGYTGLPAIGSAVTIQGNGGTIQREGSEPFRLLAVTASGDLTLDNLTLKNGLAEYDYGGAVLAYGNLTVQNSAFIGNSADAGGAIFAYSGDLLIADSQFTNNEALSGGGLSLQYVTVAITDTTISGGTGADGLGGGGIYLLESAASISHSTISGNENDGGGGGIMSRSTTLALSSSQISENETAAGNGGGLYGYGGKMTVLDSTISGNSALKGGGVYQYTGETTLQRSLVAANEATTGGGVMNGKGAMVVANSTISGNSAGSGGGAANLAVMTVENATVTGNSATGNGGGFLNQGAAAEVTFERSLIAGNTSAGQGREVFHSGKTSAGNHFNLFGFGGNSGVVGFTPGGDSFSPAGALASILTPSLANNGGPTKTHMLVGGSPAVDRSPSSDCAAPPVGGVDQRGQARNQNAEGTVTNNECDIGSIEATGTVPPPKWIIFLPSITQP